MIIAILAAAGSLSVACAEGRLDPPAPATVAGQPVVVGERAPVTIQAGAEATLRIPIIVADGYRIQANPASSEFLVPLEIRLEPVDGLQVGAPIYPIGQPYQLLGSEALLSTYRGEIEISVPLTATAVARHGIHEIQGSAHFQACNSRVCLFPGSVPVRFAIVVTEPVQPKGAR